jgi:hypothetical protein
MKGDLLKWLHPSNGRSSYYDLFQRLIVAKWLPRLQIKGDFCVDAIVGDFSAIHFSSKFLDVNRADIPQGFRPLAYCALCGILQLFGDCDISSMTLTT